MPSALTYIANIGKSVAYASVDQIKKSSPAIREFAEQNAELGKIAYQSVADFKGTQKRIADYITKTKVAEAAVVYKKALFEDLKSGKFYNRERIDQMETRSAGSFLSMDDDDPFANLESDFGDGTGSSDLDDTFSSWDNIGDDDLFMADNIDNVGSKVTQGVAMATARSAEYSVNAAKENTNLLTKHSEMMFNKVNMSMSAMNSNISTLITFNDEVMKTHVENSRNFFDHATGKLDEIADYAKKIYENQNSLYQSNVSNKSKSKIGYGDIVGSEGTVDLKQYFNKVKQNLANSSGGISNFMNVFGDDSNMLLNFVASPLQGIAEMAAKTLIPSIIDSSMKELNNTFSGFFGNLMLKINSINTEDDDTIFGKISGALKNILGVRVGTKSSINTGNYNKGPMPWDGESKMALTQVIPQLLSKILAAQTGQAEKLFDYNNGSWTDSTKLKQDFKNKRESYQKNATNDVREALFEMLDNPRLTLGYERDKSVRKDIDNMLKNAYSGGKLLPVNKKDVKAMDWGIDNYENLNIILPLLNNLANTSKGKKALNGWGNSVMTSKESHNAMMEAIEANATSIERAILNGFNAGEFIKTKREGGKDVKEDERKNTNSPAVANNIFNTKDEKGYNIFHYVRNMDEYLYHIRDAIEALEDKVNYLGSGGGYNASGKVTNPRASRPTVRRNKRAYSVSSLPNQRDSILERSEKEAQSKKNAEMRNEERYIKSKDKGDLADYKGNSHVSMFFDEKGNRITDDDLIKDIIKWNRAHGQYDNYGFTLNNDKLVSSDKQMDVYDEDFQAKFNHFLKLDAINRNQEAQRKAAKNKRNGLLMMDDPTESPAKNQHKFSDFILGLDQLSQAPAKFIGNMIHKVDQRMFQVIYGNEKSDEVDKKSFMGALIHKLNNTFRNITDFFKDNVITPISDRLFGEKGLFDLSELKEKLKDQWSNEDSLFNRMFRDKLDYIKDAFKSELIDPLKNSIGGELKNGVDTHGMSASEFRRRSIETEKNNHAAYNYIRHGNIDEAIKRGMTKQRTYKDKDGNEVTEDVIDRDSDAWKVTMDPKSYYRDKKGYMPTDDRNRFMIKSKKNLNTIYRSMGGFKDLEAHIKDDKDKLIKSDKNDTNNGTRKGLARALFEERARLYGYTDRATHTHHDGILPTYQENVIGKDPKTGKTVILHRKGDYIEDGEFANEVADFKRLERKMKYLNKLRRTQSPVVNELLGRGPSNKDYMAAIEAVANGRGSEEHQNTINSYKKNLKRLSKMGYYNILGAHGGINNKDIKAAMQAVEAGTASKSQMQLLKDLGEIKDAGKGINQYYKGTGYVRKTGIAAVSEGEMIIPAEYNPFYTGGKSRYQRKMDEEKAKHNFMDYLNSLRSVKDIHGHVDGTTDTTDDTQTNAQGQSRADELGEKFSRAVKNATSDDDEDGDYTKFRAKSYDDPDWDPEEAFYAKNYKEGKEPLQAKIGKEGKHLGSILAATGMKWFKTAAGYSKRLTNAYGKITKDMEDAAGDQDQAKLWDDMVEDVTGDFSKYLPKMIGGGLVGTGVSLATGAIGGPLLGFAAGAGLNLVTSSEKVKNWLFGEVDELGERKGNVVPKSIVKLITKYLPDMAKKATVGGLVSMLPFIPGGPVSGIILGSAIGFAKNNNKIMDTLFGKMDDDGERTRGGLFNAELRKQLKAAIPRGILGAGIGALVGGPFGLVGNALLGGTVGILTKMDQVQDAIFGKVNEKTGEREGGVVGFIEDKVVTPIGRAFDPLVKQGELLFKGFAKGIKDKVDNILDEKLGVPLSRVFKEKVITKAKKAAGFVSKSVFQPTMDALAYPFHLVEKVGDRFQRKQIANGNADYMTALQRNEYRQELKDHKIYKKYDEDQYDENGKLTHRKGDLMKDDFGNYIDTGKKRSYIYKRIKKDKYKKFDELLADRTTSYDELVEMRDALNYLKDPDKQAKKMRKDSIHKINEAINRDFNISIGDSRDILDDLSNNRFSRAMKRVRRLGLDSNNEQKLSQLLSMNMSNLQVSDQVTGKEKELRNKYFAKLRRRGLKDLSEDSINKYSTYLDQEIKNKEAMGLDKLDDNMQTRHNEIVRLFKDMIQEVKALRDPEEREKMLNNKLRDNMQIAARKRGIFFDRGNSGIFGDYKYAAKLEKDGSTTYYRQKIDESGQLTGDRQIINEYGQVLDRNGNVDPTANGAEYWDELQRRYHNDEGGITIRGGRRSNLRKGLDWIRNKPAQARSYIKDSNKRYSQNVFDENGNMIHAEGEYRDGGVGRFLGRRANTFGMNAFHLNKTEEYMEQEAAARKYKQDQRMYGKAYKNNMKLIRQIVKNKDGEYTSEQVAEASKVLDQLKENGKLKNRKGKSNQTLFANNANLMKSIINKREKLDGSGSESADDDTMYVADNKGNPIKWIKDAQGRWTRDQNDADNGVYEDDEEKGFLKALKSKFTDIGDSVKNGFNRLFRIDEEKDTTLKKVLKVGIGVLGGLTVAGFMPILEKYWENKAKPGLGRLWDEKIYPKISKYIEPIKPTIARAAAGIDNTIQKIPTAIDNLTNKIRMFITNDLPNIWTKKIIPFYKGGIEWVGEKMGSVISGLSYTVARLMPYIIKGAIQGVWQFMKQDLATMILGKGTNSAEDILKSASASNMRNAGGSAAGFGSASKVGKSMKNFSGASGLYERLFNETPNQTLGRTGSNSDDSNRTSLEDYYNRNSDSYPQNEMEQSYLEEDEVTLDGTPTSGRSAYGENDDEDYYINSVSGSSVESYSYNAATSGSNTSTSSVSKTSVGKAYDKQVKANQKSSKKVQSAVKQSTSQTVAKNSATNLSRTVPANESVSRGNFNVQEYNPGTQDLLTTWENTSSSVKNNWANRGTVNRNDNKVTRALYSAKDKLSSTFSNITGNIGNIAKNATYGSIQAYDTQASDAVTSVGGSLSGAYVDTNSCLVYDSNGLLLANAFYDPEYNEITNRPTEAAMAQNSDLINQYNSELENSVRQAGSDAYQYSNGAAYLDENGLYSDTVTGDKEDNRNILDVFGDGNTVAGHIKYAAIRSTLDPHSGAAVRAFANHQFTGKLSKRIAKPFQFMAKAPTVVGDKVRGTSKWGFTTFNKNARNLSSAANIMSNKEATQKIMTEYAEKFGSTGKDLIEGTITGEKSDKLIKELDEITSKRLKNLGIKNSDELLTGTRDIFQNIGRSGEAITSEAFENATERAVKNMDDVIENASKNMMKQGSEKGVTAAIQRGVNKVIGSETVQKWLTKAIGSKWVSRQTVEKALNKAGIEVSEKGGKMIFEASAKAAGKIIGVAISAVFIAYDLVTGFKNAETFFKMTEDKFTQWCESAGISETLVRIIAAIANAICSNILLGLIPTGVVIDIFMNYILPLFGISNEEYKKMQEASAREVSAFNSINNTNYDMADYDKHKNDDKYQMKLLQLGTKGDNQIANYAANNNDRMMLQAISGQKVTAPKHSNLRIFQGSGSGISKGDDFNSSNETLTGKLISQLDPQYKNIKFNSSKDTQEQTIGSDGCAPAVATMAINKIKQNANLDLKTAADIAIKEDDKVKNGGVMAKYFSDIYSKYDIGTKYTDDTKEMTDSISKGLPVVLLGTNETNGSKQLSPFGPNGHYVLTNGIKGNDVYIQDPEQGKTTTYKLKELLNQTKLAVIPGSKDFTGTYDNKYNNYSGSGSSGKTIFIPGTTTNINMHNENFNTLLNAAYSAGYQSGSGSGIYTRRTRPIISGSGSGVSSTANPTIIRGKNKTNIHLTTDKFIGQYSKYSGGDSVDVNTGETVGWQSIEDEQAAQDAFVNNTDSSTTTSSSTSSSISSTIGDALGISKSGKTTKNDDGTTTIDYNQSTNCYNEAAVIISQIKGSMSFSAIKADKVSNGYGIFLWDGVEGADLLYSIYKTDVSKWKVNLLTGSTTIYKYITNKKPLTKANVGTDSQKKIVGMLSSDEGKTAQINKVNTYLSIKFKKYGSRFSNAKSTVFLIAIDSISSKVADDILNNKSIAKSATIDHILSYLTSHHDKFTNNHAKDINFAYAYLNQSPMKDTSANKIDQSGLEENVSTAKVEDDGSKSNWLSELFSDFTDLGKILLGLDVAETGADSVNLKNNEFNAQLPDTTKVFIEDLSDDSKTLKSRLESLKTIYDKFKSEYNDEDAAAVATITYFETSSLFTFLTQFEKFKTDYKVKDVRYSDYLIKASKSYAPVSISAYYTENPCVKQETIESMGISCSWKADGSLTQVITDDNILKNASTKWKTIQKIKVKDYKDELLARLNGKDYTSDKPYQYQKTDNDINLISLFVDQFNLFRIFGTAKDASKVNITRSSKKKGEIDYSITRAEYESNLNSGKGSFNNDFFNNVIICNTQMITDIKSKKSRKGIIQYFTDYFTSGNITTDADEGKFYTPEQQARDDLYGYWQKLGDGNVDLDTKATAWYSIANILQDTYDGSVSSDFIGGLNAQNKELGLNSVDDFNFMMYTNENISKVNSTDYRDSLGIIRSNANSSNIKPIMGPNVKVNPESMTGINSNSIQNQIKSMVTLNKMLGLDNQDTKSIEEIVKANPEVNSKEVSNNKFKYRGKEIYNPYVMKKVLQNMASKNGNKKFTKNISKNAEGDMSNSQYRVNKYATTLDSLSKARYLMKTAALTVSDKDKDNLIKKLSNADISEGEGGYNVRNIDFSNIKLSYPSEEQFANYKPDKDLFRSLASIGFSKTYDGESYQQMAKDNSSLYKLFGDSLDSNQETSVIDALFDDDEKSEFLKYYNDTFKSDMSKTGIKVGGLLNGITDKKDREQLKGVTWNASDYFNALNKYVSYNRMYKDLSNNNNNEAREEYADKISSANDQLNLRTLIAKELLNKSDKFDNNLPIPSSLYDSDKFMTFEEYAEALSSDTSEDTAKDSAITRLYETYSKYHYGDYYDPSYIGKLFYQTYSNSVKSAQDTNGQQSDNTTSTDTTSSSADLDIKTSLEQTYNNILKLKAPSKELQESLLNGTASLKDYKKYATWVTMSGYIPKDTEEAGKPVYYGSEDDTHKTDDGHYYNWNYLSAYNGDKAFSKIDYALENGLIPAFYNRAKYLTDEETTGKASRFKSFFVKDDVDYYKSHDTGKNTAFIPDSYGSMREIFNAEHPFSDSSIKNSIGLAKAIQDKMSSYSFDQWKQIYDSYSDQYVKDAFATFGSENESNSSSYENKITKDNNKLLDRGQWINKFGESGITSSGGLFSKRNGNLFAFDDIKELFDNSPEYQNALNAKSKAEAVALAKSTGAKVQTEEIASVGDSGSVESAGLSRLYSTGKSKKDKNNKFVSQYDYGNMTFKDGTSMAEYGCGPAVAAMAINNMSGGASSIADATASIANNYKDANGTQADYFQDVFGRVGANTEYIDGSDSKKEIENNLGSGNQVVLMGNDSSNKSKNNSPFGPSNHYVLATGMNGNKIQINDPEQNAPRVYNKDKILNNTQLGVAVSGGDAGFRNMMSRSKLGKSVSKYSGGKAKSKSLKHENLGVWSEISEKELNAAIKRINSSSPFNGNAAIFIEAAQKSGLDPRYILAHAAVEAGWDCKSTLAKCNNYFGIAAFDSNPVNGKSTKTYGNGNMREGIINGAVWIKNNYYNKGQTTVYLMRHWPKNPNHQYCTSNTWEDTIASIMSRLPKNTKVTYDQASVDTETKIGVESTGTSDDSSTSSSSSSSSSSSQNWMDELKSDFSDLGKILMGIDTDNSSSSDSSSSSDIAGANVEANGDWISVVEAVKKAIAANSPGYNKGGSTTISVNGEKKSVRTDCSGMVSACLYYYKSVSSINAFTSSSLCSTKSIKGFKKYKWPGWDKLVKGDILAKNGHTEIFYANEGGFHKVWNAGGEKSINTAGPTNTGHNEGYSCIFRPNASGSGSGILQRFTVNGKKLFNRINSHINGNNYSGSGSRVINKTIGSGSKYNISNSGSSSYINKTDVFKDTGLIGKLTEGYTNNNSYSNNTHYSNNSITSAISGGRSTSSRSITTDKVMRSIGKSGHTKTFKVSGGKSKVYYEDYSKYSGGASKASSSQEAMLMKALELLGKITNNTANISEVISLLNKIVDVAGKKKSGGNSATKVNHKSGSTNADRRYSAGNSNMASNVSGGTTSTVSNNSSTSSSDEDQELSRLVQNLQELVRG